MRISSAMASKLGALFIVGLAAAFYAPNLNDGFTSESFLWVRYLSEGSLSGLLSKEVVGPALESSTMNYYRPVANLLLAIECRVWGAEPFGYHLTALCLHSLNALMIARIIRLFLGGGGAYPGFLAALLFIIYPLHSNAVIFVASHATMFCASFLLAALVLYLAYRRHDLLCRRWGRRTVFAASILSFAGALGCYEMSLAFPLLLLACEGTMPRSDGRDRPRPARWRWAPFLVLTLIYLGFRKVVLGRVSPGNLDMMEHVGKFLSNYVGSLGNLLCPVYQGWAGEVWSRSLIVIGLAAVGMACFWRRARRDGTKALVAFGVLFATLFMALSPHRVIVPAAGRYAYLPWVGLSLSLAAIVTRVAGNGKVSRLLFWIGLLVWTGNQGILLRQYLSAYTRAASLAESVQQQVTSLDNPEAQSKAILLSNYPYYVKIDSTRLAQVFHWGLADCVRPPFADTDVPLYPLPPMTRGELASLSREVPGKTVVSWDEGSKRIAAVERPGGIETIPHVALIYPSEGMRVGADEELLAVFEAVPCEEYRVVVVSLANPSLLHVKGDDGVDRAEALKMARNSDDSALKSVAQHLIDFGPGSGQVVVARLPAEYLHDVRELYGDAGIFLWVEARDGDGGLVARSSVMEWRLGPR